jgi:hypothetical protein
VKYYFEEIEKQKQLKKILDEWLNTPFRHHCGVKGLGCDCIHFVACVLDELGILILTKKTIPDYPKDWHLHNTRELLEEGIIKNLNYIYQALNDIGVRKINFNDKKFRKRMRFAYRILK